MTDQSKTYAITGLTYSDLELLHQLLGEAEERYLCYMDEGDTDFAEYPQWSNELSKLRQLLAKVETEQNKNEG